MTITVDSLLTKTEEEPVLFTQFVDKVSKYGHGYLYCFVENYDMPYYSGIISGISNMQWTSIRCKSKKNVIGIHDYIKEISIYSSYDKRFFVDSDFDDDAKLDDDIYVTSAYSIENYYVTDECMRKVLETEYEIDPVVDHELYNKTIEHFKTKRDEFHKAILEFNAWYACLKECTLWDLKGVRLNSTFPKKLLNYSIEKPIKQSYTINEIEAMYPGVIHLEQNVIETKKQFLSENMCMRLRGKYEVEFVYKYIQFLNNDAGTKQRRYTKKNKNFTFNFDSTITAMSQYADVPQGLKHYILTGKNEKTE